MKPTHTVKRAFTLPFRLLVWIVVFVVKGRLLKQTTGAYFAKSKEYGAFLNAAHRGLLIDGRSLRLTETESYQNLGVIATVGAGKTSRLIIPNVLDCAERDVSLVINDPKGEIYDATSGALARAGYRILRLDPENPAISMRLNPLLEARDDTELDQLASIIVHAGNPSARDPFWNNTAIRLLSVLLRCLRNASRGEQPGVFTMANALRLLQNFGSDGRPLATFMAYATIDPANPADPTVFDLWKGALTGNREAIQSSVITCATALQALGNQNLAWITSHSDFPLSDLRRQKTALYIVTPPQHARYYGFFTSLVFRAVMNAAMRQMPGGKDLPIRLYWDEFGHSVLPDFVAVANTIRAYKVSLTIVLQSIAQLEARYGREDAHAIQGGFNTLVTYSGSDPDTCALFEKLCGRVRERQRKDLFSTNPQDTYREYALANAGEVRTIKRNQMLVVSTNRQPVKLTTSAYFEVGKFKRLARRKPHVLPHRPVDFRHMPRVRI